MNEEQRRPNVTLDSMVALVEQAVRTIDRLQKENDALKARLGAYEAEANAAAAQFNAQSNRLQEVELRMSALIQDAEWTRWFQRKYSDSTFYNHIERVFAEEHGLPMPPDRPGMMVA
jgi:FtsZ-binding cell division protein ZapB